MHTQSTHRFDPGDRYPPPYAQDVQSQQIPDMVLLTLTPDLALSGNRAQLAQLLRAGLTALYPDEQFDAVSIIATGEVRDNATSSGVRYRFGAMGMEEVTGDDE